MPGVGKAIKETGKEIAKEAADVAKDLKKINIDNTPSTGYTDSVGAARVKPVWDEKSGRWRDPATGQFAKAPPFDLSKVDPPKGKTYEETAYRYEKPNRVDTTWDQHQGNIDSNHRYTDKGEGGVYGGNSPKTALEEVKYYGVEEGREF